MSLPRPRLAILISGRGSNMTAMLHAIAEGSLNADPVLVFSNNPHAAGLEFARALGVKTQSLSHKDFASREAFDGAVSALLKENGTEFVALAGFMRILSPRFVEEWAGKLVNIHPSLLPKYKGLDTHARALAAGDSRHGCSVHFVSPGVDEGAVIGQASVPVLPGDSEATLSARVLRAEHALLPLCVQAVISNEVSLIGAKAQWSQGFAPIHLSL